MAKDNLEGSEHFIADPVFKPTFVIIALGNKSIVAIRLSKSVNHETSMTELLKAGYVGDSGRLAKAPFDSIDLPDGTTVHYFDTKNEHELSQSSVKSLPAAKTELYVPLGREKFHLHTGLSAFVAPTGWGKTTLTEAMTRHFTDFGQSVVRFAEVNAASEYGGDGPNEHNVDYFTVQTPVRFLADMAARVLEPGYTGMTFYESARFFVFAGGAGGTGERGMDMLLPTQFTSLSNVFMSHNKVAAITINPMVKLGLDTEDDRYARMIDYYTGALDMVIAGHGTFLTCTIYSRSGNNRAGTQGKISLDALISSADYTKALKEHKSEYDPTLVVMINREAKPSEATINALLAMNLLAGRENELVTGKQDYDLIDR